MLRIGVLLFTIGFFTESWGRSLEHGNLLERIKRSPHYYDPEPTPHRPYWPPPPPYWHHYHHGSGHSIDRPPPSFSRPPPSFLRPGSELQFSGFDSSWSQGQRLADEQNSDEPCKFCKGKNAAVSNSESVNGDSISIAISRSKNNNK